MTPNHKYGYTSTHLEAEMTQIGCDCFTNFKRWMRGQTVAVDDDGQTIYYTCDVDTYLKKGAHARRIRRLHGSGQPSHGAGRHRAGGDWAGGTQGHSQSKRHEAFYVHRIFCPRCLGS